MLCSAKFACSVDVHVEVIIPILADGDQVVWQPWGLEQDLRLAPLGPLEVVLEDPGPGEVVDEDVVLVIREGDAVGKVEVVQQGLAHLRLGVVPEC